MLEPTEQVVSQMPPTGYARTEQKSNIRHVVVTKQGRTRVSFSRVSIYKGFIHPSHFMQEDEGHLPHVTLFPQRRKKAGFPYLAVELKSALKAMYTSGFVSPLDRVMQPFVYIITATVARNCVNLFGLAHCNLLNTQHIHTSRHSLRAVQQGPVQTISSSYCDILLNAFWTFRLPCSFYGRHQNLTPRRFGLPFSYRSS